MDSLLIYMTRDLNATTFTKLDKDSNDRDSNDFGSESYYVDKRPTSRASSMASSAMGGCTSGPRGGAQMGTDQTPPPASQLAKLAL